MENTNLLLEALSNYKRQNKLLQEAHFSTTQVNIFKKYYEEMYSKLIIFISSTKIKSISEEGKILKQFSDLFGKSNKLLRFLLLTVFCSTFCLIYLYYKEINIRILGLATFIVMALVLSLIRQIQGQPKIIKDNLDQNGVIIKNLEIMIKNHEKSNNFTK